MLRGRLRLPFLTRPTEYMGVMLSWRLSQDGGGAEREARNFIEGYWAVTIGLRRIMYNNNMLFN